MVGGTGGGERGPRRGKPRAPDEVRGELRGSEGGSRGRRRNGRNWRRAKRAPQRTVGEIGRYSVRAPQRTGRPRNPLPWIPGRGLSTRPIRPRKNGGTVGTHRDRSRPSGPDGGGVLVGTSPTFQPFHGGEAHERRGVFPARTGEEGQTRPRGRSTFRDREKGLSLRSFDGPSMSDVVSCTPTAKEARATWLSFPACIRPSVDVSLASEGRRRSGSKRDGCSTRPWTQRTQADDESTRWTHLHRLHVQPRGARELGRRACCSFPDHMRVPFPGTDFFTHVPRNEQPSERRRSRVNCDTRPNLLSKEVLQTKVQAGHENRETLSCASPASDTSGTTLHEDVDPLSCQTGAGVLLPLQPSLRRASRRGGTFAWTVRACRTFSRR